VPLPILSVLLTLLLALLTRFLHLDGLADLADGLWGGFTIQRRLEIMKDSRTGSFGAAALSLVLLLKTASFYSLLTLQTWGPIFVAPALARFSMVVAAYGSTYARPEGGLGQSFLTHMKFTDLLVASAIATGISAAGSLMYALPLLTSAVLCAYGIQLISHRMLGGVTGDVLGATNEICETIILALAATLANHLK
jgi:adenosylcobinamide-GDP ribazoletransferase